MYLLFLSLCYHEAVLDKMSKPFLGFLQASGLVAYIILISTFLTNTPHYFNKEAGEFLAPIVMILLFVLSAVISATIVLGRAGMLFWDKKYHESFTLLGWTIAWGLMYFLMIIIYLTVL